MSDYTLDMFCKDHDEMRPMLKVLQNIEIPEDEWPKIDIEGTIYGLNPNNPISDTIGFFRAKYGQSKATDYATRFLSIIWFINDNHDALIKEGLIQEDSSGATLIRDELLQVILDSFSPPELPVIFPTTSLGDKYHILNFAKVLRVVKPLLSND